MCDEAIDLFRQLRDEFPLAMWTGNWALFDQLRATLEAHLRKIDSTPAAESA